MKMLITTFPSQKARHFYQNPWVCVSHLWAVFLFFFIFQAGYAGAQLVDDSSIRMPLDTAVSYSLVEGDIDNDGDLDLIAVNDGQAALLVQ